MEKGQCFPIWLYEKEKSGKLLSFKDGLEVDGGYRRRDVITETGLKHFRNAYHNKPISREDIFHYIYGLLHSEDYRARFANNLSKELPRIPLINSVEDFRAFRDAGYKLGKLHVGYEKVEPWPVKLDFGGKNPADFDPISFYRVEKMKLPVSGKKKSRSTIIYNRNITVRDIPEEAWDYIVNGKSAITWIMNRQTVSTDKASGIVSDANRYAVETVRNPRYPLDLLLRIITVSIETMKIVYKLPTLPIK